jgi:hypothetical protein
MMSRGMKVDGGGVKGESWWGSEGSASEGEKVVE